MNTEPDSTRRRILDVATAQFAERGLQGVGVREICNLAGANQGAVSYHFGGKRQLYRAVLREATGRMVAALSRAQPEPGAARHAKRPFAEDLLERLRRVDAVLEEDPDLVRLLTRDLADGGTMAIEALAPVIRDAAAAVRLGLGLTEDMAGQAASRRALAAMAAPLLLLHLGGPLLEHGLGLDREQRRGLLDDMLGQLTAHLDAAQPETTAAPAG
jgi:AcrR family transcriptional regulator